MIQNGGVMNASETGNVSVQQLAIGELDDLPRALGQMRAFFKSQAESADNNEYVRRVCGEHSLGAVVIRARNKIRGSAVKLSDNQENDRPAIACRSIEY
jgi:hypothetical protein